MVDKIRVWTVSLFSLFISLCNTRSRVKSFAETKNVFEPLALNRLRNGDWVGGWAGLQRDSPLNRAAMAAAKWSRLVLLVLLRIITVESVPNTWKSTD